MSDRLLNYLMMTGFRKLLIGRFHMRRGGLNVVFNTVCGTRTGNTVIIVFQCFIQSKCSFSISVPVPVTLNITHKTHTHIHKEECPRTTCTKTSSQTQHSLMHVVFLRNNGIRARWQQKAHSVAQTGAKQQDCGFLLYRHHCKMTSFRRQFGLI